ECQSMQSPLDDFAVRALSGTDTAAVHRLLERSEYVHTRFSSDELYGALERFPAVGAFGRPADRLAGITVGSLRAFLLVNWLVPPSAWIGGFGTTWTEGPRFARYLDALLPALDARAFARGATMLYYSGNDLHSDWLRPDLEARGFC